MSMSDRKSYTIIASGPDDDLLWEAVQDAARKLAEAIDDGVSPFDVDVIKGTFVDPLNGDNVDAYGRKEDERLGDVEFESQPHVDHCSCTKVNDDPRCVEYRLALATDSAKVISTGDEVLIHWHDTVVDRAMVTAKNKNRGYYVTNVGLDSTSGHFGTWLPLDTAQDPTHPVWIEPSEPRG